MRKYLCRGAGCYVLLDTPGYCYRHTPQRKADRPAFANAIRINEGLYKSSRWRKLKRRLLSATAACAVCGVDRREGGRLEIHHIKPPRGDEELFYDEHNLIVVCGACHRKITAQEIANRRKRQRYC